MTVVVNDESKHSTFSRINIVICFIPCGGPTVICFIPCGSRAADPLDGHPFREEELIAVIRSLGNRRAVGPDLSLVQRREALWVALAYRKVSESAVMAIAGVAGLPV
ncbi:hypothetical protein J6590_013632 [Homalodisca vitripennis]|nr:hypothetical protein J6590_013632 [Homalodisca vitripennis]